MDPNTRRRQGPGTPSRGAPKSASPRPPPTAAAVSVASPVSKAGCACGGGCPRCRVQAALRSGQADDAYEREAERIAAGIDASSRPPAIVEQTPAPQVQGTAAGASPVAPVLGQGMAASGGGEPLAPALRADMESQLGVDLGTVRVHQDASAQAMNTALNARAFTYGNRIWLGEGESVSDRRLMAHELVHTVQQGAAGAPVIQRKPKVANQEWTVDHSDIGNDVGIEINVAVQYLGVNQTLAKFFDSFLESRPLWVVNKELYVRAIDFLRDNRKRFDVPDVHGMLNRALDFCDNSNASAAALTDKFYQGLLIAAVYSAETGTASFTHRTFPSDIHNVPGRPAGSTDFAPSGDNALLRPDLTPDTTVTGGFASNSDLLVKYGAAPGSLKASSAAALVDGFKSKVPSPVRPFIKEMATDPVIYTVLERFLRTDGGKFVMDAVDMGGAHYTSGKPPQIEVDADILPGSGKDREMTPVRVRTTMAHELYHYALDRMDAALALTELGGSEDHALISVVQDRYTIAELVRSGQSLASDEIQALSGYVGLELKPSLRKFIQADDYAGLRAFVRQQDFLDATVFNLAMQSSGHNDTSIIQGIGKTSDFLFDPSQITDLLYLSAINGVILRRAFELAADVAERKKLKLSAVWSDATYQRQAQSFIASLVSLAAGNRSEGVIELVTRIRMGN